MSRLLAVHGTKGCGKSVLAVSLVRSMEVAGAACVFFSFYHGAERQRKTACMLATILWHMLHFDGLPEDAVLRTYGSIIGMGNMTNAQLLETIETVVKLLSGPFYFIIDGVDELADN